MAALCGTPPRNSRALLMRFPSTNPDETSFKRKWDRAIERSADNPLDRGIERVAFAWKCVRTTSHPPTVSLHSPRVRYKNYHLFSFVPVQERLSGRVLDTAYLGAVGLWIPVS